MNIKESMQAVRNADVALSISTTYGVHPSYNQAHIRAYSKEGTNTYRERKKKIKKILEHE